MCIFSDVHYIIECTGSENPLDDYLMGSLQFFQFVPYSIWLAIIGKIVNFIATFAWSYMDLFIMMISIALTSRFRQINEDLWRIKGQMMSDEYWAIRRTQYRKLAGLCYMIDNNISALTLLALFNNLFFISVQILYSLR